MYFSNPLKPKQHQMHNNISYLIIFGSFFFLVAAFLPISRVYTQMSVEAKIGLIKKSPITWIFSQFVFGLSSIIVAIGFLMLATEMEAGSNQIFEYIGGGLMLAGAIAWTIHVIQRAKKPSYFVNKKLSSFYFPFFTIATILGLIFIGIELLNENMAPVIAWLTIGTNAVFLILYLIYKDMPPFFYYIMTLIIGFMLLT